MKIASKIIRANGDACIYVDLDETLIHTVLLTDPDSIKLFKKFPGEKVKIGGYGSMLRPGALEFLEELRSLNVGPVYLLTHSVSSYANIMVDAFGIDVDQVFSRENLLGTVGNGEKKFVLIDDLDPLHLVFQMKAQAIGVPTFVNPSNKKALREYLSRWQIKPPAFMGDPNDRGLVGLSDVVADMFTNHE